MSDDIATLLRMRSSWLDELFPGSVAVNDLRDAADEIERLREEHHAACEDRDAYCARYHKALAASVWKPGTTWRTYVNPQRSDGLFVATVGDLTRSYQAVPDRCLSLQCQLPHYDAQAVVRILNEWTESDAARAKEER